MSIKTAQEVIRKEAEAIAGLADKLDARFDEAIRAILETTGRVIVTGIGKSGLIGKKIAATLSSTGTPATFLHPVEAVHGDIGLVTSADIVLAISKSGNTEELYQLVPLFKRLGLRIILLTGAVDSTLAEKADFVIDCSVAEEACPNNLTPTSSATATMVIGDAIAMALLVKRGFKSEDFALLHPGGSLGRRLLLRVSDIMHTGDKMPVVKESETVQNTLIVMSRGRLGCAVVIDGNGRLAGIFTDGDLRRLTEREEKFFQLPISKAMTTSPRTIGPNAILDEVLAVCEKHKITQLVITDGEEKPIGLVHLHDILESKLV